MRISKLPDGTLLVPHAFNQDGVFVDTVTHIPPNSEDYESYLVRYQKEQKLLGGQQLPHDPHASVDL